VWLEILEVVVVLFMVIVRWDREVVQVLVFDMVDVGFPVD
jgi:hypothetical protein